MIRFLIRTNFTKSSLLEAKAPIGKIMFHILIANLNQMKKIASFNFTKTSDKK